MLNILLMIILLIIIIIFIILLFGIRLTGRWLKADSKYDGCIEVLIFKKLKVYTFDLTSDDDDEESDEEDEGRDLKELFELAKPCFNDLKTFFHEFLDAVNINRLENDVIIGFSSFAKTGEYIGYIWAIFAVLMGMIPNSRLGVEPSFAGQTLNIKGYVNIDISILKLIIPVLKLISKKQIRTLIRGVLSG